MTLAGLSIKGCTAVVGKPDPETEENAKALSESFFSQLDVRERGLNTEGLKEVARDVGEAFSDALEKEDANQTARSGARTSSTKSAQSSANINQRGPAKKGGPN